MNPLKSSKLGDDDEVITRAWRRAYIRLAQDPKGEKIASKHRTPFALNYKAQNVFPLPYLILIFSE